MSPAPRTRPDHIAPGDHEAMTHDELVRHYKKDRCTHEACRAANSKDQRDRRQRMREEIAAVRAAAPTIPDLNVAPATPPPAPERLAGVRVTARGVTRRIQGLMRVGHSPVAIALASQVGVDAVWWLALGKLDTVDEVTHRVIDKAFRRLRQELPEPRVKTAEAGEQLTALCRELAAEHGWVGPFDWDEIDFDDAPRHGYARRTSERHHAKGGAA